MNIFFRIIILSMFIGGTYFVLPFIQIDNSIVRWLPKSSEAIVKYQTFLDDFESDALLILSIENSDSTFYEKEIKPRINSISELEYVLSVSSWPTKNIQYKKMGTAGLFTYIVRFKPKSHVDPNRPELIDHIETIFNALSEHTHLAGTGVIHRAINLQTQQAMTKYLLAGIGLLLVTLIILIRSPIAIIQTLLVAIGGVCSILYVSAVCNLPISLAHTIIPVIILFYSTSISLHILYHSGDFRKVLKPSLMVVLTTSVGFSVFLFDKTPLLRDFALLGLAGLISSFILSLWIFYPKVYQYHVPMMISKKFENLPIFRQQITIPLFLVILIIAIPGMMKLQAEIHSLSVLSKENKSYKDHLFIESKIGNYFPLEFIINEDNVKRDRISKWVNAVYQFNEVSAVISYYRFPKYINKISAGYQSKSSPNQYRITFMIPLLSTTEGLILANKISEISTQFFGNYQPELTGFITLYANVVEGLFSSFKQSLILSFLIIFGIMTIYIRNPKLILIALIANVLPIITMLGIMGWLKINLDMVTIPIGCLLLSIVVDDTIHIMYWYKTKKSIQEALAHAGSGIFFTSVLMVLGFIILLFSPAPPVKYFAILSLFAIVTALLCDMILLPSLLDKYLKK